MISWAILGALLTSRSPDNTNPVLILLPPYAAGVELDPIAYTEDCAVRWPVARESNGNQLLSLLTGVDWVGDSRDYSFRKARNGQWVSDRTRDLKARGYFQAKDDAIGMATAAIVAGGRYMPSVMLAAVEGSGVVDSYSPQDAWPRNRLMVFGAHSWAEVDEVSHATTGRVAVVEYPPPPGSLVSRLWLRGPWPEGRIDLSGTYRPALPVGSLAETGGLPGLLPARRVGEILVRPNRVHWESHPPGGWVGAHAWFESVRFRTAILRWILGVVWAVVAMFGIRAIGDERRSRGIALGLAGTLGLPILLFGVSRLVASAGLGALNWATPILAAMVVSTLALLRQLRVPWLPAAGLVSSLCLLVANPGPVPFSGALATDPLSLSPEAVGLLLVSLTLANSGVGWPRWLGLGLVVLATGLGIAGEGWWAPQRGIMVALPVAAYFCGRQRLPIWVPMAGWIATDGVAKMLTAGIAYQPQRLVGSYAVWGTFDLANPVRFILSPGFLIPGFAVLFANVWMPAFAGHQLRRVWRVSPYLKGVWFLVRTLAILSLFQTDLIWVTWYSLLVLLTLWLIDALWLSPAIS